MQQLQAQIKSKEDKLDTYKLSVIFRDLRKTLKRLDLRGNPTIWLELARYTKQNT